MKIYIGGPMFSESDIVYNRQLKHLLLDNGFDVYCPNDNEAINDKSRNDITNEKIYHSDIEQLCNCNILLCRIALDCGTMWEAGYMDCLSKNVDNSRYFGCIGLITDIRLQTIPDPAKRGIDNQSLYVDQFVIGALKLSLGVVRTKGDLIKRLIEIREEKENNG